MLGSFEGSRLMKPATRGWKDAERNPMVLWHREHIAEVVSSDWLKTLRLKNHSPRGWRPR